MQQIDCQIENIRCASCVHLIEKIIHQNGGQHAEINQVTGRSTYTVFSDKKQQEIQKTLLSLGYKIKTGEAKSQTKKGGFFRDVYLVISVLFTIPLISSHFLPMYFLPMLHNPIVQLLLCFPVYVIGWIRIGKSGINSIIKKYPNMNALIIIGSSTALAYSIFNLLFASDNPLYFFETTASIITLVMLGHFFEQRSVSLSQREIQKLIRHRNIKATMIAFDNQHKETYFEVENTTLHVGDLILIKAGERVPTDCRILSGNCTVDESLISGESEPLIKSKKQLLIGGSVLIDGTIKAQVTSDTSKSILQHIIGMIEQAQSQKSSVQLLADKISAFFVPAIFLISIIVALVNYSVTDLKLVDIMLRSIAILVIACPCALGMATPAAVAIGMGIAARKGIFFKKADEFQKFKKIKRIVFDKTGTLTKGKFKVNNYHTSINHTLFKTIVYQIEKNSNHPIAKSIATYWNDYAANHQKHQIHMKDVVELRGVGMQANDTYGNQYKVGSFAIVEKKLKTINRHNIFVTKNREIIGWIDVKDEIKPEAKALMSAFKKYGIETILLSGDKESVCKQVSETLGIDTYFSEKHPNEKLEIIEKLNNEKPTVMVGDGINDAPSLAKATIGIAVNDASQLSIQAASVVITNDKITSVLQALRLGRYTHNTVVGNLIWAFGYNLLAIPIAAFGLLTPTLAVLIMGISDIILIVHSLTLYTKKV